MGRSILSLKGERYPFEDSGRIGARAIRTSEFALRKGVVIVHVDTQSDSVALRFVPRGTSASGWKDIVPLDGLMSRASDVVRTVRGSDSVVEGVLAGGRVSARAARETFRNLIGNRAIWTLTESGVKIKPVGANGGEDLPIGAYHLEVESQAPWSCQILQPSLEQSQGPLVELEHSASTGTMLGPYLSGSRPILANIEHRGGGRFMIVALSVDGTHQCRLHESPEGQFSVEAHRTEIRPGKEYILSIIADGSWSLKLQEGY